MMCFQGIARGRLLLAATAVAGSMATAHAATPLYWPGENYGDDRPLYNTPYEQPRRRIIRQPPMPKEEAAQAEKLARNATKPVGPLVMAISLETQTMKVYDANGLFAETPISSGIKGHATPMGVFSVIQKNKWHRSNLYSDAPMPFMQRLTWSGIALHAGVVPGHPASHGCVRMPMSFAVKMWTWTRMGARVIIAPGELSPESFTHPLLVSFKPAVPMAAAPAVTQPAAATKTADASGTLPAATATDAPAASTPAPRAGTNAAAQPSQKPVTDKVVADSPVASQPAADKPSVAEAIPAPKRSGPIAIFISRKDAKLYVRQNFAPLFDVPVTISGDQPLGTHVFTAYTGKDASKPVRWTALSLPVNARMTDEPVLSHRRQSAGADVTTPPSATDALDRLKLPDDVLARLGEQLVAGSSLLISDQGLTASGETGLGTDFIVRLR